MFGRYRVIHAKNGETTCCWCGTFCQGIKGPDGRIYCSDCYKKAW